MMLKRLNHQYSARKAQPSQEQVCVRPRLTATEKLTVTHLRRRRAR
jgi:hypothetical protein